MINWYTFKDLKFVFPTLLGGVWHECAYLIQIVKTTCLTDGNFQEHNTPRWLLLYPYLMEWTAVSCQKAVMNVIYHIFWWILTASKIIPWLNNYQVIVFHVSPCLPIKIFPPSDPMARTWDVGSSCAELPLELLSRHLALSDRKMWCLMIRGFSRLETEKS